MNERRLSIGSTFDNLSWRYLAKELDPDLAKAVVKEGEKEFDKEAQQKEQNAANERKYQAAQAEAQEARDQATQLAQEKADLEQKLAEAQIKAEEQGIEIVKLDEEEYKDTDIPLVKAIKSLNAQVAVANKKVQNLEKTKDELLQERQKDAETAARNKVYDGLLDDLDGEYGAQHRNAAVAEFDQMIKDGKVPKGDPAKSTRLMEKCYKNAVKAAKKANPDDDSLNLDSTGGNAPGGMNRIKLKPGSLAEVEAQLEASI
jgi:hypothetical protein